MKTENIFIDMMKFSWFYFFIIFNERYDILSTGFYFTGRMKGRYEMRKFPYRDLFIDYLKGEYVDFSGLHLHYSNHKPTRFQEHVWRACRGIRYGTTITYSELYKELKQGSPISIGTALSKNPFPVIVPCHRVLGKRSLGGFMGETREDSPELNLKRYLLHLEGI